MLKKPHRGFRLGRKLLNLWRWAFRHRRRRRGGYLRLETCPRSPQRSTRTLVPRLPPRMLTWGRSLARRLSLGRRDDGGMLLGGGEAVAPPPPPPKGQVAVYVDGRGGGGGVAPQRYVVPVVYFNHPLFGELLREAEEEFGFEHPGGITIPCAAARFERVAAVAAAGSGARKGFARW